MRGSIEKQLFLVLPSTSHPLIRLVLRFFFQTPGTFPLFILPALTPKDYKIRIFNQKLFWLKKDFIGGALVGISCATSNSAEAYKIADRFRRAGSAVVMGGVHASYFPEEALEHCGSVVIGEAESVWLEVLRDYENGSLKTIYRGEAVEDYFSLSYEHFLTIDPKILYRTGVLLSRGCKYRCEFCVPAFGAPRFVKLEQAITLIERIVKSVGRPFGQKPVIFFRDDNIFSNPGYAKKLFEKLIPLNLNWTGNGSIDIAFDDEALRLAKESGCKGLFIGFETIYPEKLQKTSTHHMRTTHDYIKAIKKIKSYGIRLTGSFILGFDYYTHKDYLRLTWFLVRSGLFLISITILTPFPGSRLYEQLKKEGRITSTDWRKYDGLHHVVFKPKHMSAVVLQLWFIIIRTISLLVSPCFIQLALLTGGVYIVFYFLVSFLTGRY